MIKGIGMYTGEQLYFTKILACKSLPPMVGRPNELEFQCHAIEKIGNAWVSNSPTVGGQKS